MSLIEADVVHLSNPVRIQDDEILQCRLIKVDNGSELVKKEDARVSLFCHLTPSIAIDVHGKEVVDVTESAILIERDNPLEMEEC